MKKNTIEACSPSKIEATLLGETFKGCDTAVKALDSLLHYASEKDFCTILQNQINLYREIQRSVVEKLTSLGENADDLCPTATAMLKMSIRMKAMFNKSTQCLAKMAYQGTQMGIQSMRHLLNMPATKAVDTEFSQNLIDKYNQCATEILDFV